MSLSQIRQQRAAAERRERVIQRYRTAYAAANGVECPELRYEDGWVVGFSGGRRDRYRIAELDSMTNRLEERVRRRHEWAGAVSQ